MKESFVFIVFLAITFISCKSDKKENNENTSIKNENKSSVRKK